MAQGSFAQAPDEALLKIQKASAQQAEAMNIISQLADRYGPRLMGTPNYYESVQWLEGQLREWEIKEVQQASFDRGHRGWAVESFRLEMNAPTYGPILAYPLAYTSSTDGEQSGEVLYLPHLDSVYQYAGQLKGKILLLGSFYRPVQSPQGPLFQRLSDETLQRAADNPDPNDLIIGYHSRRSSPQLFRFRNLIKKRREAFLQFCADQEVLALLEPSDFPYGILHADGNRALPAYNKKGEIRPIASFVVANEHFGRLKRLLEQRVKPVLRVELKTRFYEDARYNVNLIADLPGSDPVLKNELVIIGAHLDSWHAGTGAVDNASGCAVMMEALRLIKASGLQNKRTIRLALWGGEEQVFAGSAAYVEDNVGDLYLATPKQEQERISAYFNLDNGAGKIRGIYLMANDGVKPIFENYLQAFNSNNILTLQNANQTDHELFDFQNIPAFQFIQDPLDYITAIHHTNVDLLEYVPAADQQFNAELVAYLAYRVAQSDNLLPRKRFNSPIPSTEGNVTFQLDGYPEAKEVFLVGDFNNWNMFGTALAKTEDGWYCKLDLAPGEYVYKYIIDGYWTADPKTKEENLVKDGKGHGGLTKRLVK